MSSAHVPGGGSAASNPYDLQFAATPPPKQALELKLCEFCPRNFMRPVGSHVKYCHQCRQKYKLEPEPVQPLDPRQELRLKKFRGL